MDRNARIFVAGHRGLVGSAIFRNLQQAGIRIGTRFATMAHELVWQQFQLVY